MSPAVPAGPDATVPAVDPLVDADLVVEKSFVFSRHADADLFSFLFFSGDRGFFPDAGPIDEARGLSAAPGLGPDVAVGEALSKRRTNS